MANPTVTVGTTAVQIVPTGMREVVAITNLSATNDLFIGWDASPENVTNAGGATPGTLVPPRTTFTLGAPFKELRAVRNAVWAVASAAGTPVSWQAY